MKNIKIVGFILAESSLISCNLSLGLSNDLKLTWNEDIKSDKWENRKGEWTIKWKYDWE